MSYDQMSHQISPNIPFVSIPLEQGNVLRLFHVWMITITMRLNPFGTGQCLTTYSCLLLNVLRSLNPFGTGQCLTTHGLCAVRYG